MAENTLESIPVFAVPGSTAIHGILAQVHKRVLKKQPFLARAEREWQIATI
jgi:hypothetical protein